MSNLGNGITHMKRGWAGTKHAAIAGRNNNLTKKQCRNKRLEMEKCFTLQRQPWNHGRQAWIFTPRQRDFKTMLPLQYRRRYKDPKKLNFQVLPIPSLKAFLPFKCKYHKNSFHHWFCHKSAGSQRVIKRRHLELIINAELCMKYQMSVFKTIEKHLGRMNDCLCACTVKPMSATMKTEFFTSKIPWSFSWKQSASFYHMS